MAVSHEDIVELKKVLDDRYVLQSECNDIQTKVNNKFANDDKRIDSTITTLNAFKKLGWIAVTALIGQVVLSLLQLIQGSV